MPQPSRCLLLRRTLATAPAAAALLVSGALLSAWSCSGPSLKPGESEYSGFAGMLATVESAPLAAVIEATTGAMAKLHLQPVVRDRDGFRAFVVGETVMGQVSQIHEVRVWITRIDEHATRIEMKILGRRDEARLRALHAEIRSRLPGSV